MPQAPIGQKALDALLSETEGFFDARQSPSTPRPRFDRPRILQEMRLRPMSGPPVRMENWSAVRATAPELGARTQRLARR